MKKLIRKIKSIFVEKPKKPISWNSEEFEIARKWALTQNHPTNSKLTLWDYVLDPQESVYTIEKFNKHVFG